MARKPLSHDLLPLNQLSRQYSMEYKDHISGSGRRQGLKNYGTFHDRVESVDVCFDGIEDRLAEVIENSEVALGAIAWLTNERLLNSLSKLQRVSIVVQKEDFLREDSVAEGGSAFKKRLHRQYKALNPLTYNDFLESYLGLQEGMPNYNHAVQNWLIAADGQYIQQEDSVRCIGHRRDRTFGSVPTMHHKFVVLGYYASDVIIRPLCIITGSFNWTGNAVQSRENVVILYDEKVCNEFVSEWAQLWALSESLNWNADSPVLPSHYVGT